MIYFIGNREIKRVKIGYSVSAEKRLKDIQLCSPVKLEILCTIEGNMECEKKLHRKFANDRFHGEWFALTDEVIGFIEAQSKLVSEEKRPLPKEKVLHKCQYCGDGIGKRECPHCTKRLKKECLECHLELDHGIVIPIVRQQAWGVPAKKDDTAPSFENVVKAYEDEG